MCCDIHWRNRAQCLGQDPELWDLGYHPGSFDEKAVRAAELCAGCPVMCECAADALEPLSIGMVRAGIWVPVFFTRQPGCSKAEHVARLEAVAGGMRV